MVTSAVHRMSERLAGGDKENATVLVAAAAALGLIGGGYWVYRHRQGRKNPWPVLPGALPIIGHAHLALPVAEIAGKWETWAEQYAPDDIGCYEMQLFHQRAVIVSSEERAMEIFQYRPYIVVRPNQIKESSRSIGAEALFEAEGDQWKQEHKLVGAALNKANVRDYVAIFKVMAQRLVDKWTQSARRNIPVIIGPDLSNVAADSIAKATMDKDFDFLNSESQVGTAINKIMGGFISRGLSPVSYWKIPIVGQYLDGLGWSIKSTIATISEIVAKYEEEGGDDSKRTFLQKVFTMMNASKETIPRHRLVGNVLGLFMAGTDTTSKALVTAFYILAEDQNLQKVLQDEADAVDFESLTLQDFYNKIPRIKSFLHEVHRWYGVPGKLCG